MHTEDDTYEALCRIPVHDLERKLGSHITEFVEESMRGLRNDNVRNHAELKNQEFLEKWFPFIDWPAPVFIHTSIRIETFVNSISADRFTGTGWTLESYANYIYNVIDKIESEIENRNKRQHRNKIITSLFGGGVSGALQIILIPALSLNPLTGLILSIPIGITCGLILQKWLPVYGK